MLLLFFAGGSGAAGPSRVGPTLAYVESNFGDTAGSSETTASLSRTTGDLVVALGMTEDQGNTFTGPPTGTGLTFAAMTGSPTATASSCKGYAWSATAASTQNTTLTASTDAGSVAGLGAWAATGSDGLGTPVIDTSTARTVSVAVAQDESAVVMILGDWTPTADTTLTTVPAGGTIREATAVSGRATFLVIE